MIVVGDRFERFLLNRDTMAVSALLASGRVTRPVVVGQGLSAEQLREVDGPVPAPPHLTHKEHQKNVMIGEPIRTGDDAFAVDLVVDERVEVLEDHLTGQHIPAIVLTEAARQTWTAVTERFLLADHGGRFVIDSLSSVFRRYVFPLPATLHYRLVHRHSTAVEEVFRCVVTVQQCGRVAAEFEAGYRVISLAICEKQEAMAARQAVAECIATEGAVTWQP